MRISKHGQTILLNNLIEKFSNLFPVIKEMLIQENETPIVKEEHTDSAEQISSKDENNNSSKSDQPILRAICSCQFLTLCSFTGLTFCKCTKLNNY